MKSAQIVCDITHAQLIADDHAVMLAVKALTVAAPNAEYAHAYQRGHWDGLIRFFRRPKNIFPAGLTHRVVQVLEEAEYLVQVHHPCYTKEWQHRMRQPILPKLDSLILRPYQLKAVEEAVRTGRLAIQCPTGSGKTEIGAAIIHHLHVPTLWLVHRKDLLFQTVERLKDRLPKMSLGMMGAGYSYPDADVVVGMVQTVSKIGDFSFWDRLQCLIVDEVHHQSAETWWRVAFMCRKAPFRFGLSGTALTKDPVKDFKLEGATGPVYVAAETLELADQGFLARPRIRLLRPSPLSYPSYKSIRSLVCPDWQVNPRQLKKLGGKLFGKAYALGIIHNVERNKAIGAVADEHYKAGEKVLILCSRLDHGELLLLQQPPKDRWQWLHGKESNDVRQDAMKKFRAAPGGAGIIASTIWDEGIDLPELDVLILAGGGESSRQTLQRIGRALRPRPDKKEVLIYDCIDECAVPHPKDYLGRHSATRIKEYEEQGFAIEEYYPSKIPLKISS